MKKIELGIVIGRFQPFHEGHREIITEALARAEKVLIIIGSHRSGPSLQNPFSSEERKSLIQSIFQNDIDFIFMQDSYYNPKAWYDELKNKIMELYPNSKPLLFGHERDSSSYYLKELGFDFVELGIKSKNISGSLIRDIYFDNESLEGLQIPIQTRELLINKQKDLAFLFEEFAYCKAYKLSWARVPYAVNFVTCDIFLMHKGKFLLIERGNHPGKGKLALPGGFLEPHETLLEGALRELEEETGLKLAVADCKLSECFSDPGRDPRGRIITHVFAFEIPDSIELQAQAGDDARATHWLEPAELDKNWSEFFSDHGRIIGYILTKLGKIS